MNPFSKKMYNEVSQLCKEIGIDPICIDASEPCSLNRQKLSAIEKLVNATHNLAEESPIKILSAIKLILHANDSNDVNSILYFKCREKSITERTKKGVSYSEGSTEKACLR